MKPEECGCCRFVREATRGRIERCRWCRAGAGPEDTGPAKPDRRKRNKGTAPTASMRARVAVEVARKR